MVMNIGVATLYNLLRFRLQDGWPSCRCSAGLENSLNVNGLNTRDHGIRAHPNGKRRRGHDQAFGTS